MSEPTFTPQSNTAIFLKDISVRYNLPSERVGSLKEFAIRFLQGRVRFHTFLALNEVSLDVSRGEIFGILGRNGAGKSTLLKVISRVLIPTSGRVWVNGIVSPMLELGAGFHPELTGMENIILNATLLGHNRREIKQKIPEILDFAEIGEFIEAPLRTYSSGMVARLGFSVATAWRPDILVLDEVLSVGDAAFTLKCTERMRSFRESGATVLLVSHSIDTIRSLCQQALLLEHGKVIHAGTAGEVCDQYTELIFGAQPSPA
jgi:ABC-type polysaccharide/polyol phosphate transport system ATPase subunit